MNPIRQNYAHIKAVRAHLIDIPHLPVIPIVDFSPECNLKVKTESHVVYFHRLPATICRYAEAVILKNGVTTAVRLLQDANIQSAELKREHVTNVSFLFEKALTHIKIAARHIATPMSEYK